MDETYFLAQPVVGCGQSQDEMNKFETEPKRSASDHQISVSLSVATTDADWTQPATALLGNHVRRQATMLPSDAADWLSLV